MKATGIIIDDNIANSVTTPGGRRRRSSMRELGEKPTTMVADTSTSNGTSRRMSYSISGSAAASGGFAVPRPLLEDDDDSDDESQITSQVRFGELEVVSFRYDIGDNPAVSGGAPLRLSNDMVGRATYTVDEYELMHPPSRRRHRKKLILSVPARAQILFQCGYTLNVIAAATLEADTIRKERISSAKKSATLSERMSRVWKKTLGLIDGKDSTSVQTVLPTTQSRVSVAANSA